MRSVAVLYKAVFLASLVAQAGCNLALDPDGTGGSGDSAGGGDPDTDISVVVSVGGSSCTCGNTAGSGGDAQGGGGAGCQQGSSSSAGGDAGGGGAQSSSGSGGAPGTSSGTGGAPGTTSGAGGDPSTTSGTGGDPGTGGAPGTTSGTGGDPGGTGGDPGSGGAPGSTSGSGGAPGTTAGSGGAPGTGGDGSTSTGGLGSGGADTGTGAGGEGGSAPSACPGTPYTLEAGDTIVASGSLEAGPGLIDNCFDQADGDEQVIELSIPHAGTIHFELIESGDLDAALIIAPTCGETASQTCYNLTTHIEAADFHVEKGTFAVTVDAMGGTIGDYTLIVAFDDVACGDGVVNPGEACDVGAGISGDGCGDPGSPEACQIETPPANVDICPGEALSIPVGGSTFLSSEGYTTLGFTDDYVGSCYWEVGGVERVFAMTPEASGTFTARVGFDANGTTPMCVVDFSSAACWDQMIYARSSCESAAVEDELACADNTLGDGEEITFEVTEGVPFYLFVDGYDGEFYSNGPFNLQVELTPI